MENRENQERSVREHVELIKEGALTSEQWVRSCLDHIEATDSKIGAWAYLNPEQAIAQAQKMDDIRRRGKPVGSLHGVPVGIKDIFDTDDQPTQRGSALYADRQPVNNAAVIERLKEAGAVILGKTVSTELAYMHPAHTRNPHGLDFSPGGSSSGSAAAVAAGHVPLAIGSQTNGSTIRPASFCGIYGFKPTRGIISRRGAYRTSQTLDQVGLFARDMGDLALLGNVLSGYDHHDIMSYLGPKPDLVKGMSESPPVEPVFAWFDLPYLDRLSGAASEGFEEVLGAMGKQVDRISSPQSFGVLIETLKVIYDYEIYRCLEQERTEHHDLLSDTMKTALQQASKVSEAQYQDGIGIMNEAKDWFDQLFNDYDAVITPSSLGEAPLFGQGTGDPICCTIWTLCGLSCLSLPLLVGEKDMPIGVQLVANRNEDDRLFRTANWLVNELQNET